ncbi:AMP_1a_G0000070.mRNA.1.CDS.1 [Saccharomyces cerevisiae]|nr:AMP_1a_G0000070.mRNA.1.CDS.1 [Saccharomyces cerevisiae]CAI6465921.1 AMP_1a_G0000070.mRNA.1.CDS.1 [Saccharomyces cerevisiae]
MVETKPVLPFLRLTRIDVMIPSISLTVWVINSTYPYQTISEEVDSGANTECPPFVSCLGR